MFVLHIDLKIKPGMQHALETAYTGIFSPAISRQEGFHAVDLLRPLEDDQDNYRLSIAFDRQELQKAWVATALHQQVWPEIESKCVEFSVKRYHSV